MIIESKLFMYINVYFHLHNHFQTCPFVQLRVLSLSINHALMYLRNVKISNTHCIIELLSFYPSKRNMTSHRNLSCCSLIEINVENLMACGNLFVVNSWNTCFVIPFWPSSWLSSIIDTRQHLL